MMVWMRPYLIPPSRFLSGVAGASDQFQYMGASIIGALVSADDPLLGKMISACRCRRADGP